MKKAPFPPRGREYGACYLEKSVEDSLLVMHTLKAAYKQEIPYVVKMLPEL